MDQIGLGNDFKGLGKSMCGYPMLIGQIEKVPQTRL